MSSQAKVLSEQEFKKDYLSYLLGILVPAGINFLTIPFFKNILGPQHFGIFSFYFSILLIINTSFSGGITQSIIRLHVDHTPTNTFFLQNIWLTVLIQLVLIIPVFIYLQFNYQLVSFSLLFVTSLLLANVYTTLLAITQANRYSKISAISETIRTICMLGISLLLLLFVPSLHFLNSIFIGLATSYAIGGGFLFFCNRFSPDTLLKAYNLAQIKRIAVEVSRYGGFLVGWYFFSFGISTANRFVLAGYVGKENIGDYTASFDILNKTITVLLAPIVVSLFPLLVKANIQGANKKVSKFIAKITAIELLALLLSVLAFVFFGFRILTAILKTPDTPVYLWLDIQIIIGSFIWQVAMLQHKFLELKKKTGFMLLFVAVSFFVCLLADLFLISQYGLKFASTGFMLGGLVYMSCIILYNKRESFWPVSSMPVTT